MPSTAASEDYEHWPDDSKYWSKEAAAVPSSSGYDDNNGLQSHSYLAAKDPSPAKSPSPAPSAASSKKDKSDAGDASAPDTFFAPQPMYYPQPSSIAHPNPQFYSHPQPMYGGFPPQGYYTYAQPGPPVVVPAPKPRLPKVIAAASSAPAPANFHMYSPAMYGVPVEEAKQPQPNAWQGRTKAQVDEDNMKQAKAEGAWDKRKIAPLGLADEQMCWVIELDGSHTLRFVRTSPSCLSLANVSFSQHFHLHQGLHRGLEAGSPLRGLVLLRPRGRGEGKGQVVRSNSELSSRKTSSMHGDSRRQSHGASFLGDKAKRRL
jgi:hypothetical protein